MPWLQFFTYLAQSFLLLVFLFIAAAVVSAVVDNVRPKRPDTEQEPPHDPNLGR